VNDVVSHRRGVRAVAVVAGTAVSLGVLSAAVGALVVWAVWTVLRWTVMA
jgi:hypothetical protein